MTVTPNPQRDAHTTITEASGQRGAGVTVTLTNYRDNQDGTMTETEPTVGHIPDRLTWTMYFPQQPYPLDTQKPPA